MQEEFSTTRSLGSRNGKWIGMNEKWNEFTLPGHLEQVLGGVKVESKSEVKTGSRNGVESAGYRRTAPDGGDGVFLLQRVLAITTYKNKGSIVTSKD